MMTLGTFKFYIDSAIYDKLQRSTQYHWASHDTLNHPLKKHLGLGGATLHYMGPGKDSLQLSGFIYTLLSEYQPNLSNTSAPLKLKQMSMLRAMASLGIPLPLINISGSTGLPLGFWILEDVQQTDIEFIFGGVPRKIDFQLSLQRYDPVKTA